MKQLTQQLGTGSMVVQDVPIPILGTNNILVKNHYSIISSGTEGSTVSTARKSLIGKAKERPQQVKQVLDVLKKQGPLQTYRAVKKKLDAYSPLGYSCSGQVIETGDGVTDFKPGDYVACAGAGYANHAEVVAVPTKLAVKLRNGDHLKAAAYNTLGAIALQGIRQADLRLGESCAVIGMGLLGQLTAVMLRASGVKVVGIDIDPHVIRVGLEYSCDSALLRYDPGTQEKIISFSNGNGVDAVIITAASSSHDPINFSGAICRKKGKVVVVGSVPTGFDRDPYWYRKELELLMACSYGPGRYDLSYEEKGIDYPYAFVRWTENRNMIAFQELVEAEKISLDFLTTHEFPFEKTPEAYDLVVNQIEPFLGIALKYDTSQTFIHERIDIRPKEEIGKINISFIGAGSYAQGNLLPNIPNSTNLNLEGILTNTGSTSKRVAERFNFSFCTSQEDDIYKGNTNTIFIATRHDSHAKLVMRALENGINIFVEKPLCLNQNELNEINEKYYSGNSSLMVGFNRRFSPLTKEIKKRIGEGPMSMIYRINAGSIQSDSWIQDREIGGGRIIGEACHFIDYLTYINGSLPIKLTAYALPDPNFHQDTVNVLIEFANGSTGIIAYYANGAKSLTKEYVEIFSSGTTVIMNDFKSIRFFGNVKQTKMKLLNQNKGQKEMIKAYIDSLIQGNIAPIPFNEIYSATNSTFAVLESLRRGGESVNVK
jgi:predicted dehydrogenase/threonine dehydrogenase-like Zn-dependent dehydrogenase